MVRLLARTKGAMRLTRGREYLRRSSGVRVRSSILLLTVAVSVTGCEGSEGNREERIQATTATQPRPSRRGLPTHQDPADFPKMASHLAFNFGDGSTNSRFALNVVRGCNPSVAEKSYALNPKQVNFIVVGMTRPPSPACGAEWGFAVTYGTGFQHHDRALVSPYPGVGTIRPFDEAPCRDVACYEDGTPMYTDTAWVLNMASSGERDSTAEWAARLRAHWYLTNVGGYPSEHRGVHGIWGDNFTWYSPYFKEHRSSGGAEPAASGEEWDDGAVRHQKQLRELLGPDVVLGANGLGSTCSFGSTYEGSVEGVECTLGDATMWEGYGGPLYLEEAERFDDAIEQFRRWMDARFERRAKYGIIAQYGTCGTNNHGHPLTAKDKRMGLALATIGGVALWAVQDCNWSTTVVPGGQYSIPEMGENAMYPRGWLGQPTDPPSKAASGQWKRTFTGGIVYANATAATWKVDGVSVSAHDAVFVRR
jgi:hypothetical protein